MAKGVSFGIIAMSVLLILGVGVTILFATGILQNTLGGFTSLSISNIEIVDGGKFIRIFGVAQGAERIDVSLNPSQINQFIQDDGYSATKSISGSITLDKQIKRFPIIKKTDQNFFELKTQKVGLFSGCPSLTGYTSTGSLRSLSLSKVCFYQRGIGTNSDFSGQSIRDSLVSFNMGGSTGVLQPSAGINAVTLNDGQTKIEWTGDLSNYNQVNDPGSSYSVLFHQSQFLKLIDRNAYVLSQDEAIKFTGCMGKTSTASSLFGGSLFSLLSNLKSNSQIDSCVNAYNNRVTNILVDKTSVYQNSVDVKELRFTENALEVDLKVADAFPTFIITLDASKVGIVELKGVPKIVSCVPNTKINSGDTTNPTLSVKNIGTSDGSFSGRVSCSGSATANGIINEQFVKAGETVNMPIQVTGSNTVEGISSASCTYTIEDRKSGKTDSCISTLSVEYQSGLVCEPSSVKCIDADNLKTCSADGKTFETTKCDLGCKSLEDGSGKCKVKESDNDGDGDKPECKFYENYRQEGDKVLWILPGQQAGCYTAGWVYLVVILAFITAIIIVLIIIVKIVSRRIIR